MLKVLERRAASSQDLWRKLVNQSPQTSQKRPFLVAGTNVLENEGIALQIAEHVAKVADALKVTAVFKASWDKANRTAPNAFRGVGLENGLQILAKVKAQSGLPVVTDVHEVGQVSQVAQIADIIQVPSFLCRQTDLIVAVAQSKRIVHLKRGQFASPLVMGQAVEKCRVAGNNMVMVCERGMMFGMDDLVFDPRQVVNLRMECSKTDSPVPILVDVTHSCQSPPNGYSTHSGGNRSMVPLVARAAAAAGADGIFIECHPSPESAPVDSSIQLHLENLEPLLRDVLDISDIVNRSKLLC